MARSTRGHGTPAGGAPHPAPAGGAHAAPAAAPAAPAAPAEPKFTIDDLTSEQQRSLGVFHRILEIRRTDVIDRPRELAALTSLLNQALAKHAWVANTLPTIDDAKRDEIGKKLVVLEEYATATTKPSDTDVEAARQYIYGIINEYAPFERLLRITGTQDLHWTTNLWVSALDFIDDRITEEDRRKWRQSINSLFATIFGTSEEVRLVKKTRKKKVKNPDGTEREEDEEYEVKEGGPSLLRRFWQCVLAVLVIVGLFFGALGSSFLVALIVICLSLGLIGLVTGVSGLAVSLFALAVIILPYLGVTALSAFAPIAPAMLLTGIITVWASRFFFVLNDIPLKRMGLGVKSRVISNVEVHDGVKTIHYAQEQDKDGVMRDVYVNEGVVRPPAIKISMGALVVGFLLNTFIFIPYGYVTNVVVGGLISAVLFLLLILDATSLQFRFVPDIDKSEFTRNIALKGGMYALLVMLVFLIPVAYLLLPKDHGRAVAALQSTGSGAVGYVAEEVSEEVNRPERVVTTRAPKMSACERSREEFLANDPSFCDPDRFGSTSRCNCGN